MPKTRPLQERFWEKVSPEPNTGCWLWTGSIVQGYGRIGVTRRNIQCAHVVSYEMEYGPIPRGLGLEIDHICRERSCVNPRHLRLGTREQNRLAAGSMCPSKINQEKTHCIAGHEFTVANTHWYGNGRHRMCKKCNARRANESYYRRKAKTENVQCP